MPAGSTRQRRIDGMRLDPGHANNLTPSLGEVLTTHFQRLVTL